MTSDLETRIDAFEDGRRLILQELNRLPPTARTWRPRDKAWSSVEVAHHLALVEGLTLNGLRSPPAESSGPPSFRDRLGSLVVRAVFRLGLRVRIPTSRVRPDPELPMHAVEALWDENRRELLRHLRARDPSRHREAAIRHPIAGPMDVLETVDFLSRHQAHHGHQLERLRSDPDFPWNP